MEQISGGEVRGCFCFNEQECGWDFGGEVQWAGETGSQGQCLGQAQKHTPLPHACRYILVHGATAWASARGGWSTGTEGGAGQTPLPWAPVPAPPRPFHALTLLCDWTKRTRTQREAGVPRNSLGEVAREGQGVKRNTRREWFARCPSATFLFSR